jgi:hypothetical protein
MPSAAAKGQVGLGSLTDVKLVDARQKAAECRHVFPTIGDRPIAEIEVGRSLFQPMKISDFVVTVTTWASGSTPLMST